MTKKLRNVAIILGLFVLFVGFQNCSGGQHSGSSEYTQTTVDLGILQSAAVGTLNTHCARCHMPGTDVDTPLENILDTQQLVLDGYVVAGQPEASPIYIKAIDGEMPQDGTTIISPLELDSLRDWIIALGDPSVDAGIIEAPLLDDEGNPVTLEFTAVYQVLQRNQCLTCHVGSNPRGGRSLSGYNNVLASVTPGDAEASLLYQRVTDNVVPMPPADSGAGRLGNGDLRIIREWINNGANP